MQTKLPNRNAERAQFLRQHLEEETRKIFKEYLLAMAEIDRPEGAAVVTCFLNQLVAFTLGLFSQNKEFWDTLLERHLDGVKEFGQYVQFDDTSYLYTKTENGGNKNER